MSGVGELPHVLSAQRALEQINGHERVVLSFSGGKDSLTCLHLCRPYWDRITVMWASAGADFPETIAQMEEIRRLPVRFVEVRPPILQPQYVERYGLPVDVLPLAHTQYVEDISARGFLPRLQPWFDCCGALLWRPTQRAIESYGATLVIRGQRNAEVHRGPVRSGMIHEGIEYLLPIEDWTAAQVFQYLHDHGIKTPRQYGYYDESLDCWNCTAYAGEFEGRARYLRDFHPDLWPQWRDRLKAVDDAVSSEMAPLRAALDVLA